MNGHGTAPSRPALVALAWALIGCGSAPDLAESQLAADGSTAMAASSQSTGLSGVVVDAVRVSDPLAAAGELVSPARAWPWACVTRVADATQPKVVHITLDGCTGPFGLLQVDGEETVTFSAGPTGALRAEIDAVSLTAAGRPIEHSATLDLTFTSDTEARLIWQGSWARTDELGQMVAHQADLELTVDRTAECRTSDGTAVSQINGRTVDTVVTGYRICRDPTTGLEGCPSGSVVHTGMPSGQTVTTAYDASAVADVTGAKGDTFELPLSCTAIGR